MIFKTFALVAIAASLAIAGPVSSYGKLTAKDGHLYGAKTGTTQVQVKGMSMFWDTWDVGYNFYKTSVVDALVDKWKVEILRVAHGTAGNRNSNWQSLDDAVIQEAIAKDIYVIIDYHSHTAQNEVSEATDFFTYMAQKWGSKPNVIFEVFNEPNTTNMWSAVKSYANTIIPVIRKYSSNLIIVGNSEYSAHPEEAISDPVTDSGNNTAYTFHFYADSHPLDGGNYDGYATFRNRLRNAIQAGRTVFVTEWGTTNADGGISTSNVNTGNSDE
ncbi:MAG: glycoside hydrolase family 5 protein, partial [Fibrobacteraceae bacterium]